MACGFLIPPEPKPSPRENQIFTFDSGNGLTLDDTQRHVLVTGGTGCGKTTGPGLSLLSGVIQSGCAVLVTDQKGNLRTYARRLALVHGRKKDIVEFGTAKTATPINLLVGMDSAGMQSLLERIMKKSFDGQTGNMDFHMRGVGYARDVAMTLRYLGRHIEGVQPDLVILSSLLSQPDASLELYRTWKEEFHDDSNEDELDFIRNIDSDPFHPLSIEKSKCPTDFDRRKIEQNAYALGTVKAALTRFCAVPGIAENFCAYKGHGLELWKYLIDGKIILLRFDPGTGPVGEDIARTFISDWYGSIYAIGVENARPSCLFMDEAQDVKDLSDGRFSDKRFVSMAREFKASVIMLTQSLSGLMSGEDEQSVQSLVNNCNTNIFFHSSDPLTKQTAACFGDFDLSGLEPRQAFVVRYETETARHISSLETFNKAYAHCQELLAKGKEMEKPVPIPERHERPSLSKILEMVRESVREKKEKEKSPIPEQDIDNQEAVNADPDDEPEYVPIDDEDWISQDKLVKSFPYLFADGAKISIPVGWRRHILYALYAFTKSGLKIRLTELSMFGTELKVDCVSKEGGGKALLMALLKGYTKLCPMCGESFTHPHSSGTIPRICDDCLRHYGLFVENAETAKKPDKEENEDYSLPESPF